MSGMDATEADLRRVAGFKECTARAVLSDYLAERGRIEEMPPLMPMFRGDCSGYENFRSQFEEYGWGEPVHQRHWEADGFPTVDELLFVNQREDSYEGSIRFIWRKGSQLFEEYLSHCSCNSYREDADFRMENLGKNKITVEALRLRKMNSWDLDGLSEAEWRGLCDALDAIMKETAHV